MPLIQERWEKLQTIPLEVGTHTPDSRYCVMEAFAYVTGRPWGDHDETVPATIGMVLRRWNDSLPTNADRDRLLKPLIPRLIGLRCDKATEERRAIMIGDWIVRTVIPEILRLAKYDEEADRLAQRAECTTLVELRAAVKEDLARDLDLDLDLDRDLARALDLDLDLDLSRRLEESQSALVERMIECRIDAVNGTEAV
jgi:hypothetical protein